MKFRKIKLFVSKGWALLVCSFSVAVLALMSSCRSKKVDKAPDVPDEDSSEEVMEGYSINRMGEGLTPMVALPGDSKAVKDIGFFYFPVNLPTKRMTPEEASWIT